MDTAVKIRGVNAQQRFVIDDESKVGEARRAAQALATLELTAEIAGKVAIAATELAGNLLRHARGGELLVQEAAGRFTALDPVVTPELRAEGTAREFVSRVQRLRKQLDFDVSDRIRLSVEGDATVLAAIAEHRAWVAGEILARELSLEGLDRTDADTAAHVEGLEGLAVRVAITRA